MGVYKEWVEELEKNREHCRGCGKWTPKVSMKEDICVSCELIGKGVFMATKTKKKATKKKTTKKK